MPARKVSTPTDDKTRTAAAREYWRSRTKRLLAHNRDDWNAMAPERPKRRVAKRVAR